MQTQGISLVSSLIGGNVSTKSTKATDATFDSFMGNSASKVDVKANANDVSKEEPKAFSNTAQNASTVQAKVSTNTSKDEIDCDDVEKLTKDVCEAIEQTLGITTEQLVDLLNQMGLGIQDLLVNVQDNGQISLVNQDNIKALVMEFHGIEDQSAFLTNATLSNEFAELTNKVEDAIATALDAQGEKLDSILPEKIVDFASKLSETTNAFENIDINKLENNDIPIANDVTVKVSENVVEKEPVIEVEKDDLSSVSANVITNNGEKMESEDNKGETQDESQSFEEKTLKSSEGKELFRTTQQSERPVDQFVQKLNESLLGENVEVGETQRADMSQIVTQIVNQVKVRVLPETTSMELQLTPASLGKVNLQVSSENGVTTAKLTVENQTVKEALESQLISLKESFEEKGMKVSEVEVSVSDFSLDRDGNQANDENGTAAKSQRGKNGFAKDDDLDDIEQETTITENSRRDVNSTVDYTA